MKWRSIFYSPLLSVGLVKKPVENTHPTTKLVVTLNVNHQEHMLRALADTGASSSIILESYTSKDSIKQNLKNNTTWSTMNGQLTLIQSQ
jgi:hypothetical protein